MSRSELSKMSLGSRLKRWRERIGTVVDSSRERMMSVALEVVGVAEIMGNDDTDCHDIAARLTWITEQVLDRVAPDGDVDASTRQIIDELQSATQDVADFLRLRNSAEQSKRTLSHDAEDIAKVQKTLDSLMLKFSVSHTIDVATRLDQLRSQTENANTPKMYDLLHTPPKPAVFHGRHELLEIIIRALVEDVTCRIPLLGPGGIGKTSLAAAAINDPRAKERYGRHILFLSCEGNPTAEGIVQGLAVALSVPHETNARQAVFGYLSSLEHVLLVLDNLETAWDSPDRANVEELVGTLAQVPSLSLIITMRGSSRPHGVDWTSTFHQPLSTLSLSAARQMWHDIAGTEDDKLDELLSKLDGLPLAIDLMARQGQLLQPAELLEAYNTEKTSLLNAKNGGRLTSLEVSIQISLNSPTVSETQSATDLLTLLCLLPDGTTTSSLRRMFPSMRQVTKAALALLSCALAVTDKSRIRVLSPVRDFILARYLPHGAHYRELQSFYLQLTTQAETAGTTDPKSVVDLLIPETGNINFLLLYSWGCFPTRDMADSLLSATLEMARFTYLTGYGDCLPLLSEARMILRTIDMPKGSARVAMSMAHILHLYNRHQEALSALEDAKALFESIQDVSSVAMCMISMGDVLCTQGRYEDAMAHLETANATFESIDHQAGILRCTLSMASVCHMQMRLETALSKYQIALQRFNGLGDRHGEAQCNQLIAEILTMQNRRDEAIPMLQDAALAFESVGDRLGVAQCKMSMGDVLYQQNRLADALAILSEAETVLDSRPGLTGAAQCKQAIGSVLRMMYRYGDALDKFRDSCAMFEAAGDRLGVARCTERIGDVLHLLTREGEAITILEGAKTMFEGLGQRAGAAECLRCIAEVYLIQRDLDKALPLLEDARQIFSEVGQAVGVAKCTQSIGDTCRRQRNFEDAITTLEAARVEFVNLGEHIGAAQCMQSIAEALRERGDLDVAITHLQQARVAFEDVGERLGATQCTRSIGQALFTAGRWQEAIEPLTTAKAGFENCQNKKGIAQCEFLLGCCYYAGNDHEKAQKILRSAMHEYGKLGGLDEMASWPEVVSAIKGVSY